MNKINWDSLRQGWTTGACATAATKAAYISLLTGELLSSIKIILPKGQKPEFKLNNIEIGKNYATASIIKDAGDDPDVTHGAEISVTVKKEDQKQELFLKQERG